MDEAESPPSGLLRRLRQLFTKRTIAQPEDLEREIQHIIDEGEERGLITRQEGELIESIFDFKDTLVREIMVPRLEMMGVEQETPLDRIIALVLECGHSRFPVFAGGIDHITGILLAKDLLVFWQTPEETWQLDRVLRPAYFIPESKKISDLLRDLVERKTQIAIVIDEYGGTAGLITLEDILEEIVGEIYDEFDRLEPRLIPEADGSVLVDAGLDVEKLLDHFALPRPEGKFESVGGLLMHMLGRVPQVNDQAVVDNLELTVVSADERRAKKVRARPLPPEAEPAAP
jgi:CBS domain containing-hemolysin-like protein